ncbi:DUF624 domain-containing protein [Aquibacillus sp. 3ASR75-11]|uniref:DUF624 domain-containing protein n=1 Tax=Terrihalobacillus insolitus TaxID=2950438 RepID=A0A9X4AKU7_9BACI|nr:DUF624 domain-containing protein [Terrihalobacillus insolitus]MDC3412103.1 DUF624 domain-containing protein [Terrihalobacillus insolitus]MDC3423204.1 DUF624 domain-containing protein [Terrihalobacillus insolitus]
MNPNGGPIYRILEWITKFAYVNVLWVIFTFIGGIVFGFFPATIAMFAIVRKWLNGDVDHSVLSSFWYFFKKEFLKGNLLGLFIVGISTLMATNIYFMQINLNELLKITYIPLFVFMVLYSLFLFFIFPAFVHYDVKLTQVMKNAFLIMLVSPIQSAFIIICLISTYFVMNAIPALAFIFGGSVYTFITMWLCLNAFRKVEKKMNI